MADDPNPAPEAAPPRKRRNRLPVWIVAIALVELVAAFAVVEVVTPSQDPEQPAPWEEKAEPVERTVQDVIVNLMDEGAKRMLKVDVTIQAIAQDAPRATAMLSRPGVLEDRLIGLLSRKRLRDVLGRQDEVKQEILEMVQREVLTPEWRKANGEAKVTAVLMPEFVIQ
jgi:flagellar basal body-associated protein FliL